MNFFLELLYNGTTKGQLQMIEPDYSTYRAQLKSLKPSFTEQEIYQWYRGMTSSGWSVQTTPARGHDGKYHYLYISVGEEINKNTGLEDSYIGVHNNDTMDDGYQGSGYDFQAQKELGKKFKTYPLEFFKTEDEAFIAEKEIVNDAFLHSPYVLNRVLGGQREDFSRKEATMSTIEKTKKVPTPFRPAVKTSRRGTSFSNLGAPVGATLDYVKDASIKVKVVDDWNVRYNGEKLGLSATITKITGLPFKGNPLNFFTHNGKNLGDIQRGLKTR